MGNVFCAGFVDQRLDDRTAGTANVILRRCGQAKDFRRAAGILFQTAAADDVSIVVGKDIVR